MQKIENGVPSLMKFPQKKTIYSKTFAGFEDDHQQNSLTVKCLLDWLYTGIPPNVRSPDI